MTRKLAIFLFALAPLGTLGQVIAYVNAGYGSYSMGDMKLVQQQIVSSLPVRAAITSSYPRYYNYELGVVHRHTGGLIIGVSFGYGSTGGRVYYSDYSGDVGSDQLMSYYSTTVSIGYMSISSDKKWYFAFDAKPGLSRTKATITAYETIGSTSDYEEVHAASLNVNAQPTVTLTRKFGPVGISAYAGYFASVIKGKMKVDDNGGYLTGNGTNPAHADWSGYRIGIGLSYYFTK